MLVHLTSSVSLFFFNDTATTGIYTLSLHDALPISRGRGRGWRCRTSCRSSHHSAPTVRRGVGRTLRLRSPGGRWGPPRQIGEHTSELQSHVNLVCRLLLEKKKKTINTLRAQL